MMVDRTYVVSVYHSPTDSFTAYRFTAAWVEVDPATSSFVYETADEDRTEVGIDDFCNTRVVVSIGDKKDGG